MLKGIKFLDLAKSALLNGQVLRLEYDGFIRDVEVHCIGTSKQDNLVMRVYQVSGDSQTDKLGWKLMKLDEVRRASVTSIVSQAPRPGYAMDDRGMIQVIQQLESKT